MAQPKVEVYAPSELIEAMDKVAEDNGWSRSETWRRAAGQFLNGELDNIEESKQ